MSGIVGDYRWRLGEELVEIDREYDEQRDEWIAEWLPWLPLPSEEEGVEAARASLLSAWGESFEGKLALLRREWRRAGAPMVAGLLVLVDWVNRRLT